MAKKTGIEIKEYSFKSIVVTGKTKPIEKKLLTIGGVFNPRLRGEANTRFAGWIFPKKYEQYVKNELNLQEAQL